MNLSHRTILALASCLAVGSAIAHDIPGADLKRAEEALAAGKYQKAYEEYRHLADEHGDGVAQFSLGLLCRNGWGRAEDPEEACGWFLKAAKAGIPAAAHFYAEALEHGWGCKTDPPGAALWYRQAAELGHHGSLCSLADLTMRGHGVDKNPREALELCRRAIALHVHGAEVQLGRFLLEGDESVRDERAALAAFEAAALHQSPEGQVHLATMLREGRGCDANPPAARHWFESAAAQGHVPAYLPTAELYVHALPDPKTGRLAADHLAKAYLWLRAAEARCDQKEQLAQARKMLAEVREVMPKTWAPDLDARVEAHLAEFSEPKSNSK